ncbi:hypothetical protein [Bradyrhizobium sp. 162]|uniref:hypothetical protein n=1 Tax=Bradyrhizobium sp. 162 TaxID=2782635 RepID=UPI001FF7553B|nr:hypothetical protein [Bradyrhizobium sp. 162]MCK1629236.1 hypothetical protein [Bradyrhizobium sp. 162]
MEEILKKLAEHFGFAAPFGYAALAYGFFLWLDKEASDEAKAALARTMRFKDYKNEQVASALVEVFDRIYTHPLLRWRAFFRPFLITTLISALYVYETWPKFHATEFDEFRELGFGLVFNLFSDYLSLFVIRPLLIRSGTTPVIGLAVAAVSGIAIVLATNSFRWLLIWCAGGECPGYDLFNIVNQVLMPGAMDDQHPLYSVLESLFFTWPALAVFVWLPLFALGILTARLLTPLSWLVGRTQWFLKEGKDHPLKAIGYVATIVVFLCTVAARADLSASKVGL